MRNLLFKILLGFLTTLLIGGFFKYRMERRAWQDKVINVRQGLLKEWEKDKDALVVKSEVNEELKDVLLEKDRVILKWKTQYFDLEKATQIEIVEDSVTRYKVEFKREDECISLEGFTLTHPPEDSISYQIKPVTIERELLYIKENEVYAKFWTNNSCVTIEDAKVEIPPDLNLDLICPRYNKFLWFGLGIAGGMIVYHYAF